MPPAPRWIAISAASVLGLGVLATGAVGVAQAMPLVDSTTTAAVPPISTVPGDVKGSNGLIDSSELTFPVPSSTPDAATAASPSLAPSVQPAPVQPAPAAPAQPVSPNSVSVASPDSADSAD
ncbi:MAG: hypothetical protein Q7J04_08715 [Microcella sp.]|nr:hypothetical protein [Microcella sp.]